MFYDIEDLELENFNQQNVIQSIVTTRRGDRIQIWIASLYGADITFSFKQADVLSVEGSEYYRPKG